ncbi:MAG: ParB N-terminal domain-containing protein [Spirochaetales bacterium]|nr:ParB N-terminal domain-containing protein [Spirochaetales bacterium]
MRYDILPVDKVELDIENPRIKHFLSIYSGKQLTSENLALALAGGADDDNGSKYNALKESIRKNGGIFTPIIVNHITIDDRYVVIEGNTRLKFYQEFLQKEQDKKWSTIISIVYDDMSEDEKHAIRLQAHMVGSRDWDPFSKAKYLDYLYNTEKKSMEYLKVFCGGQQSYILHLIHAYNDMSKYYADPATQEGEKVDPQKFSYYFEAQKNRCNDALSIHGYDMNDFTSWVLTEKIERAEHVRNLPKILGDEELRNIFLKQGSSAAIRKLEEQEVGAKKLSKTDTYKMVHELSKRLNMIPYKEVISLKTNPKYKYRKEDLFDLQKELNGLMSDLKEEENE